MEMAPTPINSDEKISEKEGEREKLLAVTHTHTHHFSLLIEVSGEIKCSRPQYLRKKKIFHCVIIVRNRLPIIPIFGIMFKSSI